MWFVNGLAFLFLVPSAMAQNGESLYLSQCAVCHGAAGEGGRGAVLNRTPLRRAATDEVLYRVIRRGIPDSGMPGTALSDKEIRVLMEFVRKLANRAPTPIRGSAAAGARLYEGKGGCARCHSRNGSGATTGPDLSGIGTRRSQEHLRQSLVDPAAHLSEGFVLLGAVTVDGKAILGSRVNEDTFSVQIRDIGGDIHSFWKTELKELKLVPGRSLMPSYKDVLTAVELDDLTAFLAEADAR